MKYLHYLIAGVICLLMTIMPAQANRHALVIGNAKYENLVPLQKTIGDAQGYRDALETLGFTVSFYTDLNRRKTDDAIAVFLDSLTPGDEAFFVFSGHGWSDGRSNYLLPTDAPKSGSTTQLARRSIALKNGATGILDEIAARGARLQVSVIDACRNNPFAQAGGTKSAGLSRGLVRVAPPRGSFVVYSAGTGEEALDRLPGDTEADQYSVFTRTFLPLMTAGLSLEDAIGQAQVETAKLAAQVNHIQSPAYYDETLGKTCLDPEGCKNAGRIVRATPDSNPAKDAFNDAKGRGTRTALEDVAELFPDTYWGRIAERDAKASLIRR